MMGHRQKLNGDGFDLLYWRKALCLFKKAGVAHKTKKRLSKARRREDEKEIKREMGV
jgi:hypothetical protein